MKVLLIAKSLDLKSGAGRCFEEIKKALEEEGAEVSALGESPNKSFFGFLKDVFRIRREAKNFEIVHALDVWFCGVAGYFAVIGTKKKLFLNGIGTYSVPGGGLIKKFLMEKALRRARHIFCISDYTRKRILEKIKLENISTVLYAPTRLPSCSEKETEEYRNFYKIKNNYPVLLSVGGIKERKGQFDTLVAAGLIKKDYPRFKYVMIGGRNNKYYLEKIKDYAQKNNLEENYEIVLGVPDDKLLSFFYRASDIFLLNSVNEGEHFEGFGLVFWEAAQFAKPLIGSRDCGVESAIKNGYNGYLTLQRSPQDIKEKILLTLRNKEELSRNSQEFCRNFTWEKTAAEYIKHYE